MKALLLLACFIVLCDVVHGQESVTTTAVPVSKNIDASSWQIYVETADFRIEYIKVDCDPSSGMDFQSILLRFTNLTSNQLELDWHLDLDFDGTCRTCGIGEYDRSVTLSPNEIQEGDCDTKTNRTLDLFVKFIDAAYSKGAELTSFKLNDLTVH